MGPRISLLAAALVFAACSPDDNGFNWDGIADAGVVADDVGLTHEPVQMLVDRKNPRVEITITESAA